MFLLNAKNLAKKIYLKFDRFIILYKATINSSQLNFNTKSTILDEVEIGKYKICKQCI